MPRGQLLGVEQVGGDQLVRVDLLGVQLHDVEHVLGVGDALGVLALGLGAFGAGVLAEQFGGLVQQHGVRRGPRLAVLAQQQGALLVGVVGHGRGQPLGRGEQVGQQLLRGQFRPQPVQHLPQLRAVLEFPVDLGEVAGVQHVDAELGGEPSGDLPDQGVDHGLAEHRPGQVVPHPGVAGPLPRARAGGRVQPHHLVVAVADRDGLVGQFLPVADGGGEHLDHVQPALEFGGLGGFHGARVHPGVELAHGLGEHAGLAQRRQHLVDVAQERGVGADQQHAAPGQPLAVGVEQVGGPVQGHGGLAGARTALHHQHAVRVGADDLVLLGLDGGDDVAHPPGAVGVERGQQGGLAGQPAPRVAGPVPVHRARVEHLVVDAGDGAPAGPDVPAAAHPVRGGGGGHVERGGGRGAPVHQQWPVLVGRVEQADATDVAALSVRQVEAPETQSVLGRVELRDPVGVQCHGRVPLNACLGISPVFPQCRGQLGRGLFPLVVEAPVEHGQVFLLASDLLADITRNS